MMLFGLFVIGISLGFVAGRWTGIIAERARVQPLLRRHRERYADARRLVRDISQAWVRFTRADAAWLARGAGTTQALEYYAARDALTEMLGQERQPREDRGHSGVYRAPAQAGEIAS